MNNSHPNTVCGVQMKVFGWYWQRTSASAWKLTQNSFITIKIGLSLWEKKISSDLEVLNKCLCLNGQSILPLPFLLLWPFVVQEKAMLRRRRVHGESIIPRDFKSFAWGKCDFAKACFQKGWRFCAIFSVCPPPHLLSRPPLPLLFTSIPLLF